MRRSLLIAAAGCALAACAPVANVPAGSLALGRLAAPGALKLTLQAATADVATVELALTGGAAPLTRSVPAGTASVELADLAPGTYQLAIAARAADGRTLGTWSGPAIVAAGSTTPVTAALALTDAPGTLRVLVEPPAAGTTGLAAEVTFVEPAPLKRATVARQYLAGTPGKDAASLALQADGSIWIVGGPGWGEGSVTSPSTQGKLYRVGPDGALVDRTPAVPANEPAGTFDLGYAYSAPGGLGFVLTSVKSEHLPFAALAYAADGTPRTEFSVTTRGVAALAPDGAVWTSRRDPATFGTILERHAAGSAPADVASFPEPWPGGLLPTADGHIWAYAQGGDGGRSGVLRRYDAAGTKSVERPLRAPFPSTVNRSTAVAPDGGLWAVDREDRVIRKVAPDGTIARAVSTIDGYDAVHVDARGHVWLYQGTHTLVREGGDVRPQTPSGPIAELDADGTPLAFHHVADDVGITDLAVAADGALWLATIHTGVLKVTLDAP